MYPHLPDPDGLNEQDLLPPLPVEILDDLIDDVELLLRFATYLISHGLLLPGEAV